MRIKNESGVIIGEEVRAGIAEKLGISTEDQRMIDLVKKIESLCFVFYEMGYNDAKEETDHASDQSIHEATSKLQ